MSLKLDTQKTAEAKVEKMSFPASWRLELEAGSDNAYRLAQLDDYRTLPRNGLKWQPPLLMRLEARVSERNLPGTWGFGFWNDPFSINFGHEGAARRLPSLPNTLWYFHASQQNYLSLRDDLPAHGMLAGTFSSPAIPSFLLALGLPAVPLLGVAPLARCLRRMMRCFVHEDSYALAHDVTEWHEYGLEWQTKKARFIIDGVCCFTTENVPAVPLGFVLWIDNQYAAFTPSGNLKFGKLSHKAGSWLEVKELSIDSI